MKRILAATAAVAAGVGLLVAIGTSQAHVPDVAASCTGLSVHLARYKGVDHAVSTTIDGRTYADVFNASYSRTFAWTPEAGHSWRVVIVSADEAGATRTFTGAQEPCTTSTGGPPSTSTGPTSSAGTTTTSTTTDSATSTSPPASTSSTVTTDAATSSSAPTVTAINGPATADRPAATVEVGPPPTRPRTLPATL